MNMASKSPKTGKQHSSGHDLAIGQYRENIYFADTDARLSDYDQTRISGLLMHNQGVGIIIGRFDEKLSIRMISSLACRLLGYRNAKEVLEGTQMSLAHIALTDADYIRGRLADPDGDIWGCSLRGKDGNIVSVRIGNMEGTAPDGERQWYLSVRRVGEMQYDILTGEYNRYGFINHISDLKARGTDLKKYVILYINIRNFKAVNELYGSEFGDKLLMKAYHHFCESAIRPEACARKNADRFLLLVKQEKLDLDKLPNLLKVPYTVQGKEHCADCICGIYPIDNDEIEINTMIDCAKMAVKEITDVFVKPYAVFRQSMRADYLGRRNVLTRFDNALANSEFKVYFQPVVDCNTGRVASAEALIRWQAKDGLISPAVFLPALEENGCITKLDEYVLTDVVRYLRHRSEAGQPLIPISVNVSRMDFFDKERTQRVYELMVHNDIARRYTHFEITETSYRSIKELQADFIAKVNAYGGKVYIDDFGVANSSIDLLSQYDFSVLKLDMRFIQDMLTNRKVRTLVSSTIRMAHDLNMKVIAEGVETEEQLSLLRQMACDYIQGYYFSKPLDEESFTDYLNTHI